MELSFDRFSPGIKQFLSQRNDPLEMAHLLQTTQEIQVFRKWREDLQKFYESPVQPQPVSATSLQPSDSSEKVASASNAVLKLPNLQDEDDLKYFDKIGKFLDRFEGAVDKKGADIST